MKGLPIINKKIMLLALVFFVLILFLAVLLVYKYSAGPSSSIVGKGLKNYTTFKTNLEGLKLANGLLTDSSLTDLNTLENKSTTSQDKYAALVHISILLSNSYSRNKDSKTYIFVSNDLNSFAKENFPSYYKQIDFLISCQDPSCAPSPIPKEIQNIIDEINALKTVSDPNKQGMIENLKNAAYSLPDTPSDKADYYLSAGYNIRTDGEFTKAGVNNKIADEVEAFVKNKYPNDFKVVKPN